MKRCDAWSSRGEIAPNPLSDDYFGQHPATDVSGICGDGNNPAYYFKRH